jgi:nitrous oxidase accessory protein NosD
MEPYANANNTFYHNNFIDNTIQLDDSYIGPYPTLTYSPILSDPGNSWDNGSEGNYWSDYETKYPDATELDSSGIWNTPYSVIYLGMDNFPLVHPYPIPSFPSP